MAQSLGNYDSITVTAPTGGVVNGQLRLVGKTIGVVDDTTAAGSSYTLITSGEFLVVKAATTGAVGQGDKVYHTTPTGGLVSATSEAVSGQVIGIWSEATTTTATSAKVLLTGHPLYVAI